MALGRRLHTRVVSGVVAVIIGAGLVLPSPAIAVEPATTWDLADDFRFSPNQLNPSPDTHGNNDVWHYMEASGTAHDPATYSLLPTFTTNWGGNGIQGWTHGVDQVPYVLVNPSNRQAAMHVGNTQNVIVGWKSPITGTVYVSGRVRDEDATGTGVLWTVDKGSTTIASGSIAPGAEQLFSAGTGGSVLNTTGVAVTAGDFLYFIVDPNVQAGCTPNCGNLDGNQIAVTISDQPIVGPHRWRANGNANDYIGTNHGTLQGGATASGTPAVEGTSALSLDGINDYVSMPSVPSHYFPGSFTIEAWVKTTDTDGTILAKYECGGASCGVPPDHTPSIYQLYLSGGLPAFRLQEGAPAGGAIQGINGTTVVNNDAFHRIVAVRDVPADLLALYVDGVLVSLASLSSGADGPLNDNDVEADPLTIGAFIGDTSDPGVQSFLSGLIDDVQLFNEGAVDPADFDPSLTDTEPDSPANDNNPEIKGSAIGGSTVNLYTNSACTGSPVATGSAADFGNAGLTVNVPDDSTSTFFATATVGGATSSCSTSSISYTEQTTVAAQFLADQHIKRSKDASFLGNNTYNTSGLNQTVLAKTKRSKKAVFNLIVQNDGTSQDALTVTGCGKSRGFKVTYTDVATGNTITSQITTTGFTTPPLAPGGTRALLLTIKVKAAGPKKKTCVVTATSQGNSSQDVVIGKVKAKG